MNNYLTINHDDPHETCQNDCDEGQDSGPRRARSPAQPEIMKWIKAAAAGCGLCRTIFKDCGKSAGGAQSTRLTASGGGVARVGRIGAAARAIGLRRGLAGELARHAAHDAFRHRMRGRQHRQVDLEQGAEVVVVADAAPASSRARSARAAPGWRAAAACRQYRAATSSVLVGSSAAACARCPARTSSVSCSMTLDQRVHDVDVVRGQLVGVRGRSSPARRVASCALARSWRRPRVRALSARGLPAAVSSER